MAASRPASVPHSDTASIPAARLGGLRCLDALDSDARLQDLGDLDRTVGLLTLLKDGWEDATSGES
jgi:hypothetical protein